MGECSSLCPGPGHFFKAWLVRQKKQAGRTPRQEMRICMDSHSQRGSGSQGRFQEASWPCGALCRAWDCWKLPMMAQHSAGGGQAQHPAAVVPSSTEPQLSARPQPRASYILLH